MLKRFIASCSILAIPVSAQEAIEVGKHANSSLDAVSMIISLLIVLALIVVSAFILKKFNLQQSSNSQMKVVSSLSLGAKERLVVVQVGKEQLLLGVGQQQVTLIKTLEEPIEVKEFMAPEFSQQLSKWMKGQQK